MISTVTVTTITAVANIALVTTLSMLAVILLVGLLTYKELLTSSTGERHKLLARSLNVAIIPLFISFAVVVTLKVIEILG